MVLCVYRIHFGYAYNNFCIASLDDKRWMEIRSMEEGKLPRKNPEVLVKYLLGNNIRLDKSANLCYNNAKR